MEYNEKTFVIRGLVKRKQEEAKPDDDKTPMNSIAYVFVALSIPEC